MEKLIVLNYSTAEVHIYSYSTEKWPEGSNIDKLVESLGHRIEDVEYMTTDKEIIQH